MRNRTRSGTCGPGCWPTTTGCNCDSIQAKARQAQAQAMGFITNEITMSLDDGSFDFGFISPQITTMLGQEPEADTGSGKVVFWALSFGLGIALGAAFGISHGVKIGRQA